MDLSERVKNLKRKLPKGRATVEHEQVSELQIEPLSLVGLAPLTDKAEPESRVAKLVKGLPGKDLGKVKPLPAWLTKTKGSY